MTDNVIKLVVIGDIGVGKSCIIRLEMALFEYDQAKNIVTVGGMLRMTTVLSTRFQFNLISSRSRCQWVTRNSTFSCGMCLVMRDLEEWPMCTISILMELWWLLICQGKNITSGKKTPWLKYYYLKEGNIPEWSGLVIRLCDLHGAGQ